METPIEVIRNRTNCRRHFMFFDSHRCMNVSSFHVKIPYCTIYSIHLFHFIQGFYIKLPLDAIPRISRSDQLYQGNLRSFQDF